MCRKDFGELFADCVGVVFVVVSSCGQQPLKFSLDSEAQENQMSRSVTVFDCSVSSGRTVVCSVVTESEGVLEAGQS